MPARLNRALQVRTADRLRSSLARDQISGQPVVGQLSDDDQRELREAGGGRLAAVVVRVEWVVEEAPFARAMHEVQALVMREVARRVDQQLRRTDLLGSLRTDALVILAPALDPMSGQSLAERLRQLFASGHLEVGDLQVRLRVKVGFASRSAASPAGWTTQTLAEDADRHATDLPPIAIVA